MVDFGDVAPDAAFDLGDGKQSRASDWRGHKLVIYFYPKDDTPGCTKEAQGFTQLAAEFAAAETIVIGISKDSVTSHAKFAGKYGLQVLLGSDSDGSVCEAFGVWVEKAMYGKKYMGIERATFLVAADGKIARVWRKVKVPGHPAEVLAAAISL
jgi:thioredoxin-dependent peroxiredoxin